METDRKEGDQDAGASPKQDEQMSSPTNKPKASPRRIGAVIVTAADGKVMTVEEVNAAIQTLVALDGGRGLAPPKVCVSS